LLDRLRRAPRVARVLSFGRDLVAAGNRHRVTGRASEVAFWWMFTLFPALLVLASVIGLLDTIVGTTAAQDVRDEIVRVVADFTGSRDNEAVVQVRQLFERGGAGLLTLSALVALWSTSRSFTALIYTLDEVYGVVDRRSYFEIRSIGVAMAACTISAGALVLVLLVVGPLLGWGDDLARDLDISSNLLATAWRWLRLPFAAVVLVAFHVAIFCVAPWRETSWRAELPGAVTASTLWCVASLGFSLYLDVVGGSSLVVGVLGGALSLMLWLYLLAIGMLLGGEVNAVLAGRRARSAEGREPALP
jgi:membrane protein